MTKSEAQPNASGSDSLAGNTEQVEANDHSPAESEESVGTDESTESGESSGSEDRPGILDSELGAYD